MKKVIGIVEIILGAIIAVGPYTFLHVCGAGMAMEGEMAMRSVCQGIPPITLILGAIILVIGISEAFGFTDKFLGSNGSKLFAGIDVVLGIVVIGVPTFIVGVCSSAHMHCHAVTRPALIILGAVVAIIGAVEVVFLRTSK